MTRDLQTATSNLTSRAAVPLLVATLLLGSPLAAGTNIVLLPLGNASGNDEAAAHVRLLLAEELAHRGWSPLPAESVEPILESQRVRRMDSLTSAIRLEVGAALDAKAFFHGTILTYSDGRNPAVAVTGRMTDLEGRTLWGEVAALSAAEAEGMLGLGRPSDVTALAAKTVARLMRGLPRPGNSRLSAGPGTSPFRRAPMTFRSSRHARGEVKRICVLPFQSSARDATLVISELLTIRLAATGQFEVVEAANFREAMRKQRFHSVSYLTSEELREIGQQLDTTLFLRGNVHTFRQGSGGRSEVQIDLNLADVATGEILWAVAHQRHGLDFAGAFGRGTVDSAVALADRVVSEIVIAQSRAQLRGPASARSGNRLARREE